MGRERITCEYFEIMEGYERKVLASFNGGEKHEILTVRTKEGEIGCISQNLAWVLLDAGLAESLDGKGVICD